MKGAIVISLLVGAIVSQASWQSDVSSATVPKTPATGKLHGNAFKPMLAKIKGLGQNSVSQHGKVADRSQAYILEFSSDKEFFPAQQMQVWFTTDLKRSLSGLTFAMKPYAFGTDGARKQSYGTRQGGAMVPRGVTTIFMSYKLPGKDSPKSESFMDKYSIRLEFGKQAGKTLPGKIYLALPDSSKSFLAGSFTAKIE
jgi:hypothetical protein